MKICVHLCPKKLYTIKYVWIGRFAEPIKLMKLKG
jgi:hypothetical protein